MYTCEQCGRCIQSTVLCEYTSSLEFELKLCLKVIFLYSAVSSPLDRSKRFTPFALPDRLVHSDTNSASPGIILAMQQLRATTNSLTVPPTVYSQVLIYTAESTGASVERMKMPNVRNGSKRDSNPGSLY